MRKLITLALILFVAGCGHRTKKQDIGQGQASADSIVRTGADRDNHGCIGSAGYTWSEVRQECIRLWEVGVQVFPVEASTSDTNAITVGYIVFSEDSARVELFFPNQAPEILERRSLPNGGYAWNIEDDDTKNVRQINSTWIVEQRGKLIYTQKDE